MKGRAVVRFLERTNLIAGARLRGFVISAIVVNPYLQSEDVIIEGPGLPKCEVGAMPRVFNSEKAFIYYLQKTESPPAADR